MSAAPGSEAKGGFLKRHRRALLAVLGVVAVIGFVHFALPEIAGLGPTLRRLEGGNAWWLALGVFVETLSIAGEVVLLRGVFSQARSRIGWRASYEITLAGAARLSHDLLLASDAARSGGLRPIASHGGRVALAGAARRTPTTEITTR
jgi:hypothetical protein